MTAATGCRSCGAELLADARFCHSCGAPVAGEAHAEYKQVTVLFADVVHSMDIAAAVGPERLREIMGDLVTRSTAVVQRYGGTVDKFTGDGIMAVFGAPVALEDHAFRACLAALGIQQEVQQLPEVDQQLRIGLNSGQVIAGEIGSGPMSYTAIGEHVGMAQRMESVAPAGGVMLSESTARLVEHFAVLAEPEMVQIKGADDPVLARRLISTAAERDRGERNAPTLVGRAWEINTITGLVDEAVGGVGSIVNIVGPAGIGKSRLTQEAAALAADRGFDVVATYCESHTSDLPFHAVTRLLRTAMGVDDLDEESARARVRARVLDADPEDLLLLDDLLGIADPNSPVLAIEPDARRRRLMALVNALTLARTTPTLFVIEDVHWIDEVSEAMLAGFLAVIPQSRSIVLLTYRPEYQGTLARVSSAQAIALRPLSDKHTSTLIGELLGSDSSTAGLAEDIAERAAGNPFFAEELVRDLAERNVLEGSSGAYRLPGDLGDVTVPATLQATIAARIDRLAPAAKATLNAAAVIGFRFGPDLLTELEIEPSLDELVSAELIDQVKFTRDAQYEFRHPLVRAVAYEAQLKSDRAQLHRRLAGLIEQQSSDEDAALIAEHLEAAGGLHEAFGWHMRAGTWLTNRDIKSARLSWERARQIADRLPPEDPNRVSMRIAPRTLLGVSAWRAGGTMEDARFEELRALTSAAGDKVSLAIAMAGQVSALTVHDRIREASQLSSEYPSVLESIGDPTLTVALLYAAQAAKLSAGELAEVVRLCEQTIELADGDAAKGNLVIGSPLASAITIRGVARCALAKAGWRDEINQGMELAKVTDSTTWAILGMFKYGCLATGALHPDAAMLRESEEILEIAESSGYDLALASALFSRGLTLVHGDDPGREEGFAMLARAREAASHERFTMIAMPIADAVFAQEKLRIGDVEGAIELSRAVVEHEFASGERNFLPAATEVLVESLLTRGDDADVREAHAAVERLGAVPIDPAYALYKLVPLRLRALLARARGDDADYQELTRRFREMAESVGYEPQIAKARQM